MWEELRDEMIRLDYPENQYFDPEIEPNRLIDKNKRMSTIYWMLVEYLRTAFKILDVGCNKGLFSLTFCGMVDKIIGIDPLSEYVILAKKIRDAHGITNIHFYHDSFAVRPDTKSWEIREGYDLVHFGQCAHYIFRDAVRCGANPLWFLSKAAILSRKYIVIDGAFEGDPSVEFDAKQDNWTKEIKDMATIEGYAEALRPKFKLIKYGWSGDGATRYLAVFEKVG